MAAATLTYRRPHSDLSSTCKPEPRLKSKPSHAPIVPLPPTPPLSLPSTLHHDYTSSFSTPLPPHLPPLLGRPLTTHRTPSYLSTFPLVALLAAPQPRLSTPTPLVSPPYLPISSSLPVAACALLSSALCCLADLRHLSLDHNRLLSSAPSRCALLPRLAPIAAPAAHVYRLRPSRRGWYSPPPSNDPRLNLVTTLFARRLPSPSWETRRADPLSLPMKVPRPLTIHNIGYPRRLSH